MWKTSTPCDDRAVCQRADSKLTLASAIEQMMAPLAAIADDAGLHRIAFLMHEIVEEAELTREIAMAHAREAAKEGLPYGLGRPPCAA